MLFRVRPSEVAAWPAWEIGLLDHFLAREPDPITRVEVAVARLMSIYVNAHQEKGHPPKVPMDFMTFAKAWDGITEEEYQQTLIDLQ